MEQHQNKFMQFIEALHTKLPHQARMNYTTMHMDTYFVYWHVQINLDVYTVWCNNLDNPVSWGWDRN